MCKNCIFCGYQPEVSESAVEIQIFCDCSVSPYVSNENLHGITKNEVRIGWNYLNVRRSPYLNVNTQLEGNFGSIPKKKYKESKIKCPSCKEDGRKSNLKFIFSQGIYGCHLCGSLFLVSDESFA